jgi:hypothetical protein
MTFTSVIGGTDGSGGDTAALETTSNHTVVGANRAPDRCPLAPFFPQGGTTEVVGISLAHMAGGDSAEVGDLITFTTWILNATTEALTDVTLHLRSFTNEHGDHLSYRTEPMAAELTGRTLGPRQALKYYFSYEVTQRDVPEPGLLISALRADLVAPSHGRIYSECDAFVTV